VAEAGGHDRPAIGRLSAGYRPKDGLKPAVTIGRLSAEDGLTIGRLTAPFTIGRRSAGYRPKTLPKHMFGW
jgi:hypothetical protein